MYPTLYDAFKDLFGWEIPFLQIVMTFGFFVAMAFLAANWAMTVELKRKEKEGIIQSFQKKTKPINPTNEYISSLVVGFLIGYKILFMVFNFAEIADNPQAFILSSKGSVLWGAVAAAVAVVYKYFSLQKLSKIEQPESYTFHPYQMMGNMTILAAVTGFIGAKLFHHLEYWEDFIADPITAITEPFSGLTFFGGLIFGGAAVLWYANRNGVKWRTMLDVGGPAMMLAYGVGRMGCHFSGDGDWGIVNSNPKPDWLSWLPDWAWAYHYPNNVLGKVLIEPVYPTPMYEVIMALILFGILWAIRKRIKVAGVLFGVYLIFSGIERYFIEKIRVNPDLSWAPITQAELISICFILVGGLGSWYLMQLDKKVKASSISEEELPTSK